MRIRRPAAADQARVFRNVSDVYVSRFSGKLGCREQDFRAVLYLRGGNSLSKAEASSPQSVLTF